MGKDSNSASLEANRLVQTLLMLQVRLRRFAALAPGAQEGIISQSDRCWEEYHHLQNAALEGPASPNALYEAMHDFTAKAREAHAEMMAIEG